MDEGDIAVLRQDITTPNGRCPAGTRVRILAIDSVNLLVDDSNEPEEGSNPDADLCATVQPEDSQTHFEVMLTDLEPASSITGK